MGYDFNVADVAWLTASLTSAAAGTDPASITYQKVLDQTGDEKAAQMAGAIVAWAMINQQAHDDENGVGGGGSKSWLVMIARALGKKLGEIAEKMVDLANSLERLTGEDDAQEFMIVNAELQAQAQMFNVESTTLATVVKSVGEGMAAIARKQ